MKRFAFILGLLSIHATLSAQARNKEIVIEGSSAFQVHVKGLFGKFGNQATETLRSDLAASELVSIVSSPRGAFVASGQIDGTSLSAKVLDPGGGTLLQKTYSDSSLKENAHAFARDIIGALGGDQPASGTIAFVSTRTGRKEIYTCNADGSNVRQITRDNGLNVSPGISPDGSQIAHTGYNSGYADIYLINTNSGARRKIIDSPGTNSGAAIAPDGSRLALTMSFVGNPEIFVTSTRGGRAKRLTNTPGIETSPSWSPDGSKIVYSSDSGGRPQLYTISSRGGSPRAIRTGYGYCVEPSWSPDGKKIAFCVRQGGTMRIAVHDLSSGKTSVLGSGEDPTWSPDSNYLAFTRSGTLIVRNQQSGKESTILRHGKISEPSWSRQ
ncbi:MAG: hypothetical protein AAGA58_20465 [Verrucomicrobiota bacterium]